MLGRNNPRIVKAEYHKENINDYGRFDALKATVVKEQAQEYFYCGGRKENAYVSGEQSCGFNAYPVFLLEGGMDIPEPENWKKESAKE